MDSIIYVLFICVVAPLLLMLPLLKKRSKLTLGFMILGIVFALFISEVNSILLGIFDNQSWYVTTTITPLTEEFIKALPILFYAFVFSDNKRKLLILSFATGIGFGLFENTVVLVQSLMRDVESVSIGWALIRGFSTALMHGVCTCAVGYGISFVKKRRKLFYCGTFSLLVLATIYHGIYNMLVQSDYKMFGFILPIITYLPILIQQLLFLKNNSKKNKSEANLNE